MVTGFTNSQKLSWMNNLIMALELEYDPASQKMFHNLFHLFHLSCLLRLQPSDQD
jgi:hypothetical protein